MEKRAISINNFLEKLRAGEKNLSGIILQNADFTGMDLKGINFSESDFTNSNFSTANLTDANFSSANMARCLFKGAVLRGTNFGKANLEWAIFTGAIFENTDLQKANLMWAHLCKSDLLKADIKDAIINWSCLADSKLSVEQMSEIPSETMRTITFVYEREKLDTQSGEAQFGIYSRVSSEKPSLLGYATGKIKSSGGGNYGLGGSGEESHHATGYAKPGSETLNASYGPAMRQDTIKIDVKRLRPVGR